MQEREDLEEFEEAVNKPKKIMKGLTFYGDSAYLNEDLNFKENTLKTDHKIMGGDVCKDMDPKLSISRAKLRGRNNMPKSQQSWS